MTTPYVEELALVSRNNEGISQIISLTTEVDGVIVPVDLTGKSFFAQARSAKSKTGTLICEIQVSIVGDPTEGKLLLSVSDVVMKDVNPIKGHYDVLTRTGVGVIDNLYMAPFIVEGGVTDTTQWL